MIIKYNRNIYTCKTSDRPSANLEILPINFVGGSVDIDDLTCNIATWIGWNKKSSGFWSIKLWRIRTSGYSRRVWLFVIK